MDCHGPVGVMVVVVVVDEPVVKEKGVSGWPSSISVAHAVTAAPENDDLTWSWVH